MAADDEEDIIDSDDDFDDDDLIPDDDDLEPSDDEGDDENDEPDKLFQENDDPDAEESDFDSINGDNYGSDAEEAEDFDSDDNEIHTTKKTKSGGTTLNENKTSDMFTSRLMTFTPEEIEAKLIIVRNSRGIPKDENHQTSHFMTEFEHTSCLGTRAGHINQPNCRIFIDLPFIFKREFTDGTCEFWRVSDLALGKRTI